MAPVKRKRNERSSVDAGENRPSPHRPGNTSLGSNSGAYQDPDMRNGGRRSSRRGRGGRPRNDRRNSSDGSFNKSLAPTTPALTPVPPPTQKPPTASQQLSQLPISTPSPAPAAFPKSPEPQQVVVRAPFDYSHITDARLTSWSSGGRQEVIAVGAQALDDVDILDLSTIFQELIRATLDARLDAEDAGTCVKDILATDPATESEAADKINGASLFLDTLSIMADVEQFDHSLSRLIVASGVSPGLMRQILDAALLQNLGLTRLTFIKAGIRQVTNLLYRQANHNLLREETEGYAKLVTELFTTSGSEPPSGEVVEDTFERVKGLIGTFDLDVGRVLDVTLDVFAAVLVKHFRFFVKLLRVSSWWPRESGIRGVSANGSDAGSLPKWALPGSAGWSTTEEEEEELASQREERDRDFWNRAREIGLDSFYELGGRHPIDMETKQRLLSGKTDDDSKNADSNLEWIEATGTLPPSGNRVAAQLLGFKLRFYTSPSRDKDDVLPANLIYLTALLIKIGFISLRDLYPHLWPSDEEMPAMKAAKLREMEEKARKDQPQNALTAAVALPDDTLPNMGRTRDAATAKPDTNAPPSTAVEDKDKLPEPIEQKGQLLINLLTIGAIPEALFLLSRFQWLPEVFPEVYDLLHRILHHSINKVYEPCLPIAVSDPECQAKKWPDADQSSAPKGTVRRNEAIPRKALRWPFPDKHDHEGGVYRFYWDEWADNIPVCQTVDDIFTLCSTFLNLSGVNIGRDATLLSKFAAIGNKSLAEDNSETNRARWQDLLKRLLVPAISLTKSNTSVVNEIFDMLRHYPATVRYNIYAEWNEGQTSRVPIMMSTFAKAKLETLSTMKRISKTNLTVMARALAKTAYANPGVVFKVALSQIEAYSNLTEVVVECAKYFTDLGYDVLIWSLMTSLGGQSRSRTRDDSALLTSRWLIALSRFSGKIFRRYSMINPAPLLQYVNDQLFRGNATDLIILEDLVAQMSGVVSDVDFTDAQLLGMTGGELLRRQTLINLQDKRFESIKTARRLMRSLTETGLAGQLLVSIAQHKQAAFYGVPDDEAHIKYLATMIDDTQRILVQYLDLLRSNLTVEQFDELVPNTIQLMADFGLEPALAFLIGRASFAYRMALPASDSKTDVNEIMANGTVSQTDSDGDAGMSSVENAGKVENQPGTTASESQNGDIEMVDVLNGGSESIANIVEALPPSAMDPWQEALKPLVASVQELRPPQTWDLLTPEFYVVFWQLALIDISMPIESYMNENTRLTKEISDLMKDRSDMTRNGVNRKEETRKTLETTRDNLLKESKDEMIKYERTRARLNREKGQWFSNVNGKYDALSDALIEECFLPRLLQSPTDADYCFKMIKFLHNNGTPHFRTLSLYGHLFRANRLRSMIFSCTIREAECLGRFLKLVLGDITRWHSSKATYEKEALGANRDLPGFAKKLGKDSKPESVFDYEDFRRAVFIWHKQLNTALKSCLSGSEWMHIRNAITVLKAVVEYFPAVNFMGEQFKTTLMTIGKQEEGKREDLSLLANAVMPELKKREKKWVMMQAFATNLGDAGQQAENAPSKASKSDVEVSKSTLKPTAPEFKPQSLTSAEVATSKPASIEVEDGEVDDTKTPIAAGDKAESTYATSAPISPANAPSETTNSRDKSVGATTESPAREPLSNATPLSTVPSAPSRPDASRNASSGSTSDRPPQSLPNRPDVPFPSSIHPDRHPSARSNERRDGSSYKNDHPSDPSWDRGREYFSGPNRRSETGSRESGRLPERPPTDREWDRHDSGRQARDMFRDSRDRDSGRSADVNGRLSRDDLMAPPRSLLPQSDRGGSSSLDRSVIDRQEMINPERAALISGNDDHSRQDFARGVREDYRDRPSRLQSPRRGDRFDRPDARYGDHQMGRGPTSDIQDFGRSRREDSQTAPLGPRGERPGDRGMGERIRDASAFMPSQAPHRPIDPEHGRLNPPSRQSDPNFGRLNQGPDLPDAPSGPRSHAGRGGSRQGNAPQNRVDSRSSETDKIRPPTPDRIPPTGPASTRPPRRAASSQSESVATSQPASAAPTNQPQVPSAPPTSLDPSIAESGIHPDRLKAFQADMQTGRPEAPALQTSSLRSGPSLPSPQSSGPPSGPRSHPLPSPTPAQGNGPNVPTGPAFSSERGTRAPRRQLQGINSTLQQAGQYNGPERPNDRGTSIRGRGASRMGSGLTGPDPSSAPSTPMDVPPPDFRDGPNERQQDLFSSRPPNPLEGERDNRSAHGQDPSRREKSGRQSRRNSHSRSPDRDRSVRSHRGRQPMEDERNTRNRHDFRESRAGGDRGEPDRRGPNVPQGDRDSSRRDGRDNERPPSGRSNDGNWNRPPLPPPPPPPHVGERSRDARGRGVDDSRRDSRSSREDGSSGSRKRRSDGLDGPGMKRARH